MTENVHVFFTDRDEFFKINEDTLPQALMRLTTYIIENYQEKLLKEILTANYNYIPENEQMFIIGNAYQNLSADLSKEIISAQLKSYIREHNQLNIDGFVRFRLQAYMDILEDAVECAVNEYIVEIEYNQLILYLTKYVELQEPLVSEIYITAQQGIYKILNESFTEIVSLNHFEDTMLDILITLAPKKIYIYNVESFENKQLLKTIRRIFKTRLYAFESDIPIPVRNSPIQ